MVGCFAQSIHPFYGDLLNILYDRDHYKLALGQVAACISRIERISKEYITLSKYSDSLYKSKSLKTAAFGRCCTGMKQRGVLRCGFRKVVANRAAASVVFVSFIQR